MNPKDVAAYLQSQGIKAKGNASDIHIEGPDGRTISLLNIGGVAVSRTGTMGGS